MKKCGICFESYQPKCESVGRACLSAQTVGNALYGLQSMSSDHEEVRDLLQVLSTKVQESTACLSAQNVGNALYGLQSMSSDHEEVRDLLRVLSTKVRECR